MTKTNTASRAVTASAPKAAKPVAAPVLFAGRGKSERATALLQIAPLSFAEDASRAASLANLRKVLGDGPTDAQVKAARVEYTIGRVASRLPVSELLKGKTKPADRLERARDVVTRMAMPPKEGATPGSLRKGQIGRRSPLMQKAVRAADEACSLIFGELGLGKARSQTEKNKRQAAKTVKLPVAPSMAGSGKGKAKTVAPTPPAHQTLVKPSVPTTADDVVGYLSQLARLAKDWSNKHAKHCPVDAGLAAQRFHSDMLAAANALQERKAIAAAADKGKPKLAAVK